MAVFLRLEVTTRQAETCQVGRSHLHRNMRSVRVRLQMRATATMTRSRHAVGAVIRTLMARSANLKRVASLRRAKLGLRHGSRGQGEA